MEWSGVEWIGLDWIGFLALFILKHVNNVTFLFGICYSMVCIMVVSVLFHIYCFIWEHLSVPVPYPFWFRFFPSKYNREIKCLKMEVETLLMEIIQSRKDCVEIGRSNSYGNDLLGMLLNEMQKKKGNGNSINLQLVMDQCKTFFFAGHETTALLLTWTVMLLASNTSWQDKVREEVKNVCNGEIPSLDQLSKLTLVSTKFTFSSPQTFRTFLFSIYKIEKIKLSLKFKPLRKVRKPFFWFHKKRGGLF